MAPSGCTLDDRQLTEQLSRYRRLSRSVLGVDRHGSMARVRFSAQVDAALLQQTLMIERGCCRFFVFDYDVRERALSITADAGHDDALSSLMSALSPDRG